MINVILCRQKNCLIQAAHMASGSTLSRRFSSHHITAHHITSHHITSHNTHYRLCIQAARSPQTQPLFHASSAQWTFGECQYCYVIEYFSSSRDVEHVRVFSLHQTNLVMQSHTTFILDRDANQVSALIPSYPVLITSHTFSSSCGLTYLIAGLILIRRAPTGGGTSSSRCANLFFMSSMHAASCTYVSHHIASQSP